MKSKEQKAGFYEVKQGDNVLIEVNGIKMVFSYEELSQFAITRFTAHVGTASNELPGSTVKGIKMQLRFHVKGLPHSNDKKTQELDISLDKILHETKEFPVKKTKELMISYLKELAKDENLKATCTAAIEKIESDKRFS